VTRLGPARWATAFAFSVVLASAPAHADLVVAEPATPIAVPFPSGAPEMEAQVVLQLVIDASGHVESVVVASHAPEKTPAAYDDAAVAGLRSSSWKPSMRDGQPFRSRVEYVVVFHPAPVATAASGAAVPVSGAPTLANPATTASGAAVPVSGAPTLANPATTASGAAPAATGATPENASGAAVSTNEQDEDYREVVEVRGKGWSSPRGLGDLRIKRELLDASPRQETSEMLSAAPGFFVDHEDGEGFGNDVYLRGFDLDHGSGIEMRVGNVPINSPVHVQGQGYADANFIIPEVVRSIRVLEGSYDPRQGDTAIVGSAYFDLGVPNRGNLVKASVGSFNQLRVVGVTAPKDADEETFAAFAVRKSDGFGQNRASESATVNAQYGFDVATRQHLRFLATAYGVRATLPGVVRQDDLDAGRIGLYDSYPNYTSGQGVQTSRVILGADFDDVAPSGARFELAPWVMWTDFRARQNLTGNIYSSLLNPELAGGQGDLWESTNQEDAIGVTSRYHTAPLRFASFGEVVAEPGVTVRAGHTDQTKSLLNPTTLVAWDRRLDAGIDTLDAGAYLDVDVRLWKRLRISGGVRADLLAVGVDDRLGYDVPPSSRSSAIPDAHRGAQGVALSPRVTAEYDVTREIAVVGSYGEGFRSLDATANVASAVAAGVNQATATAGPGNPGVGPSIQEGARPYSKVRSFEGGVRVQTKEERYTATASLFETHVDNELVFEATSGGFATEGASIRRGVVSSVIAKPTDFLTGSVAVSVAEATFTTLVPGISHFVPGVPPVLVHADVSAHGPLVTIRSHPLTARVGVGYTFLGGRHLTDAIVGPTNNVLNAGGALRYRDVELSLDAYNLLNLHYADDEEYYVSNFSVKPGTALASAATHLFAAPPLTVVASLAVYF